MKTNTLRTLAASAAFAAATGAGLAPKALAWTTSITDTTGYVVQSVGDGYNENSIISGMHFPGGAPVAGKKYLVNNELTIRSPASAGTYTFQGDSLTLDGGAYLLLKGAGSKVTIADLRVFNAGISQGDGNSEMTLCGGLTVYGTPSAPTLLWGNGVAGWRSLVIESAISGGSDACIKVMHDVSTGDTAQYYAHLKGDNSGYAGSIEVENGGIGICLVGYGNNAFGASPRIKLTNDGRLFGGGSGTVTLSGAALTLDNGGSIGVYSKSGNNVGLQLSGGTINGTGVLTIKNSGMEGSHSRRVALGNVSISGIDRIQVDNGVLQFNSGYNNPATPIVMTQPTMLRTAQGISAGPVTLQSSSYLNTSGEDVTFASLTFEQTSDNAPYIIKLLAGTITITGDITNRLNTGAKMRIDFSNDQISPLASTNAYRILSAANLGMAGGPSADDFEATASYAPDFVRQAIAGGTFSIEDDGGRKYLVYTLPQKVVYSTGGDGYNDESFTTRGHWSDSAVPHSDANYFICNGHQIRSKRYATSTFNGHTLSVLNGGTLAVQGETSNGGARVDDLRLFGGSTLTTTTDWGNNLNGNVTVYGSSANPAVFLTGVAAGNAARAMTVNAAVSGSGSIHCRYQDGPIDPNKTAVLHLRGDNTGFTGEWGITHPAAQATFAGAANFGSASALVFCSNGVFYAQGASFAIPAGTTVTVRNAGTVSGSEELTNGGTFLVDAGQTLTVAGVVSGNGILRKTGAGALRLDAENTISAPVVVKEGFIGGVGKVAAVELKNGTGFDVSATQATPLEIGALTIDGGIVLNISDFAAANSDRIAIARVGALSGTLPDSPVSITIDGRPSKSLRLSLSGGVIYAERSPFVMIVR